MTAEDWSRYLAYTVLIISDNVCYVELFLFVNFVWHRSYSYPLSPTTPCHNDVRRIKESEWFKPRLNSHDVTFLCTSSRSNWSAPADRILRSPKAHSFEREEVCSQYHPFNSTEVTTLLRSQINAKISLSFKRDFENDHSKQRILVDSRLENQRM